MTAVAALRRWHIRARATQSALTALQVEPLVLAQLLINRGIAPADVAEFVSPERVVLCDPGKMKGIRAAVDRLGRAIAEHEPIAIFGDYDVDGLSGAAILQRTLAALGGRPIVVTPERVDGHGLSHGALEQMEERGARLVVTVDCGSSARDEIAAAFARGIDVIVTDHHLIPVELPQAVAVLNPRQSDCAYAYKALAGCGVAFALARAMLEAHHGLVDTRLSGQLAQLAALGTVADMVPLLGENRAIVAMGVAAMRTAPLPGIRALMARSSRQLSELDAETIAFALAPRLNAANRVGSSQVALDLLLSNDPAVCERLAMQLDEWNRTRQQQVRGNLGPAREQMQAQVGQSAILVSGNFPHGILGLLAGQLVEATGRPSVVLAPADGQLRGSARGPAGVNVVALLGAAAHLLDQFGGHERAAGLSLATENLDAFRETFIAAAERAGPYETDLESLEVDCLLRAASINRATFEAVQRLQPFGYENARPVFATRGLTVRSVRRVGENHAQIQLVADGSSLRAIAFRGADTAPQPQMFIDLAYTLRADDWQGQQGVRLEVVDWRPTDEPV